MNYYQEAFLPSLNTSLGPEDFSIPDEIMNELNKYPDVLNYIDKMQEDFSGYPDVQQAFLSSGGELSDLHYLVNLTSPNLSELGALAQIYSK